jgi:hypothetical protein
MLSKLSSKKTRAAWVRKLFKYQKWVVAKKICSDVEALLDDCKNAKNQDSILQVPGHHAGVPQLLEGRR